VGFFEELGARGIYRSQRLVFFQLFVSIYLLIMFLRYRINCVFSNFSTSTIENLIFRVAVFSRLFFCEFCVYRFFFVENLSCRESVTGPSLFASQSIYTSIRRTSFTGISRSAKASHHSASCGDVFGVHVEAFQAPALLAKPPVSSVTN
jgi:hypothetical protein